jgi:hypothetical protein
MGEMANQFMPMQIPQTTQSVSQDTKQTDVVTPMLSNLLQSINEINKMNQEFNQTEK